MISLLSADDKDLVVMLTTAQLELDDGESKNLNLRFEFYHDHCLHDTLFLFRSRFSNLG